MMNIEKIIDDAFRLYCPQVRSEITDLSNFLLEHFKYPPENILEIGTKYGGTFYIWNSLWSETVLESGVVAKKPTCISIDMSDGGIHGGISEEDMDKRDLWFLERFDNCHFIRGDSHDEKTRFEIDKLISSQIHTQYAHHVFLLNNRPLDDVDNKFFDFIFIDGDHSYEGVKKDFYDYISFCKPKSFVCFHDIIISDHHHSRNVYVGEFWNEIKNNYKHWEIIGSDEQYWAGIGIIQLP